MFQETLFAVQCEASGLVNAMHMASSVRVVHLLFSFKIDSFHVNGVNAYIPVNKISKCENLLTETR